METVLWQLFDEQIHFSYDFHNHGSNVLAIVNVGIIVYLTVFPVRVVFSLCSCTYSDGSCGEKTV